MVRTLPSRIPHGRLLDLLQGTSGLSLERTIRYRKKMAEMGFVLPELDFTGTSETAVRSVPSHGPGTEFFVLTQELQVEAPTDIDGKELCNCPEIRHEMNFLGVEGCRSERERLLVKIKANVPKISWLVKLRAAKLALLSGLAFKLDPLDPIGSLFDEAVTRAENNQNAKARKRKRRKEKRREGQCCGRKWRPPKETPIQARPFDGPIRRNLIMHLWPVKGFGAWQWNLDQVLRRAELFNGRRIVSIATGPDTDSVEAVKEYLRDFTDEFIVRPNSVTLREVLTFVPMLERIKSNDPNEVTFSCHGKCVRHRIGSDERGSTVFRWTAAMYETCLDRWPDVEAALQTKAMAGSFKRHGSWKMPGNHAWHYSGTFYWFRHNEVFARDWRTVDKKFFGTESWPGRLFSASQAACLFCDDTRNLYDLKYFDEHVEPALQAWRAACTQ